MPDSASSASPIVLTPERPVAARTGVAALSRVSWETVSVVGVGLAFYAAFIARTAFRVDGRLTFALFDDGMISMRYARNLAEGHGLVWNPGEHPVEGYTNPLWTLWMAVLHLFPFSDLTVSLAVMVSGALLLAANVCVVGAIARRLSPVGPVPVLAMTFTALYYPLVFWTLRGMEVGLLALLFSLAVLLALRLQERFGGRDLAALCVVVAASLLTRIDAIAVVAVVCVFVVFAGDRSLRRRTALALASTVVGVLAAQTAFRLAYYGLPLPNTYYLKLEHVSLVARLHRGIAALGFVELAHLWAPTLVAAAYCVSRRRSLEKEALLLAAVFVTACLYSVYVGADAWEWMKFSNRYITPVVPFLLILAALGLQSLPTIPLGRAWRRLVIPALFVGVFVASIVLPSDSWSSVTYGIVSPVSPQLFALVLAALWFRVGSWRGSRHGGSRAAAAVLLGIAMYLAVEIEPVGRWVWWNASEHAAEVARTRLGVALRESTAPDASIAAAAVGAISYFSQRRTIDELGKSDHVIATRPRRLPAFMPGHDRWDLGYSIRKLRPDVIAQLPAWSSKAEQRQVRRWGYRPIYTLAPNEVLNPDLTPRMLLVRVGDPRVAAGKLDRLIGEYGVYRKKPNVR